MSAREYGKYRLIEPIGEGSLGSVWRAEAPAVAGIARTVALRRIAGVPRNRTLDGALTEEARLWLALRHANAVALLDFGEQDGELFFVMDFVDGISAGRLARSLGSLPAPLAVCITERVARALAEVHAVEAPDRWTHRAVRASNVLVSTRGEIKLTDFGIARVLSGPPRTRPDLLHLAPEQVRGDRPDARTDIFCLGAMLHLLVTGKPLLPGAPDAVLRALEHGEVPPPPATLDPRVRELISVLTAPDPRDRMGSATEVARAVRAFLLPDAPEDVEPELGAKVRALRGGAVPEERTSSTDTTITTGRGPGLSTTPTPPSEKTVTSDGTSPSITMRSQQPAESDTVIKPLPVAEKRVPSWAPFAGIAAIAGVAGIVAGRFLGSDAPQPTPTPIVIVTSTPEPAPELEPIDVEMPTATPISTPTAIATRTRTAGATAAPIRTPPPTPKPSDADKILGAAQEKIAQGRDDHAMLDLYVAVNKAPNDEELLFGAWRLAAKSGKRTHASTWGSTYVEKFGAKNPSRARLVSDYLGALP